jgi:hypothetical protein
MSGSSAPETETPPPLRCPACASEFITRIARRGPGDYFRFLVGRYPFRCRRCGQVFYLPHRGSGHQRL